MQKEGIIVEDISLIITDITGRELRHEMINSNSVDLSEFPNGLYIYKILSSDAVEKTGKLIISK